MKFICEQITPILLFVLSLKFCTTNATDNKFSKFYYMENQVFALKEDLQIDGLEEDSSFTGGFGVKNWLVLPSNSFTYLIGVKRRGLSLITISKKDGSLFQAVEKPMDIEGNITSAIAFNILNNNNKRSEGIVVFSTDSPKYEIMWYKIRNYRLTQSWSWVRYSGTASLHYFRVSDERGAEGSSRLLVLDSSRITAHVYRIGWDTPTPNIRELEVMSFEKPVLAMSLSVRQQEPFLYVVHRNELGLYRYKRLCSEGWIGNFERVTSLRDISISNVYPFRSEGQAYLALAGKDSAVWKIEPSGAIVPEIEVDNILEWIVMRTGPHKERILLFGKSGSGDVKVFSNAGAGWSPHPPPPCYKFSKEKHEKVETHNELRCLRFKSWAGVASLEIGDLPTLVFSDRRFYGEMFHVMVKMKRDVLPFEMVLPITGETTNPFDRMRSNLDGLVSDIEKNRGSENVCSIFDVLTSLEKVVFRAKKEYYESCSKSPNFSSQNRYREMLEVSRYEDSIFPNDVIRQDIDKLLKEDGKEPNEAVTTTLLPKLPKRLPEPFVKTHPISPDLVEEIPSGFQDLNDMIDMNMAGIPKKQRMMN